MSNKPFIEVRTTITRGNESDPSTYLVIGDDYGKQELYLWNEKAARLMLADEFPDDPKELLLLAYKQPYTSQDTGKDVLRHMHVHSTGISIEGEFVEDTTVLQWLEEAGVDRW